MSVLTDNIDKYCEINNTSRSRLEQESGLFNAAIMSWARGKTPNLKSLEKIVNFTGISLDTWTEENGIDKYFAKHSVRNGSDGASF